MPHNFQLPPEQMDILERYPALFGLAPGGRGLTLIDGGFACGGGWYPILDRLFADLAVIRREDVLTRLRVVQVKEKFGGLRVYVDGGNERIQARIGDAETEAAATCEHCGGPSPGLRSHGGWYGNICDSCAQKRRSER